MFKQLVLDQLIDRYKMRIVILINRYFYVQEDENGLFPVVYLPYVKKTLILIDKGSDSLD